MKFEAYTEYFKDQTEPPLAEVARQALSYRDSWEILALARNSPSPKRKVAVKQKSLMHHGIREKWRELLDRKDEINKLFTQLAEINRSADQSNLSKRAHRYLRLIFKLDLPACPPAEKKNNDISAALKEFLSVEKVLSATKDMVDLKRFFKPEGKWREVGIFKKELLYAQRVVEKNEFRDDFLALIERFKSLTLPHDYKFSAWNDQELDFHESQYADARDESEPRFECDSEIIPLSLQFQYQMTLLCRQYMLSGFIWTHKKIQLLPQLFHIDIDNHQIRALVPMYMKIDQKLHWPGDVISHLQMRPGPLGGTGQERLRAPHGSGMTFEVYDAKAIQTRYNELRQEGRGQQATYIELNKEFFRRAYDDPESLYRCVRRKLDKLGIIRK